MTKFLYPAPGRVIILCEVVSIVNGKTYVTREEGVNSMQNVSRELKGKIRNAQYNAIYKHMKHGGNYTAQVTVTDYDIVYFDEKYNIRRKRVNRDGRYYSVATDAKTGKRVGKVSKWRTDKNINGASYTPDKMKNEDYWRDDI